jgi:O-antigen/teichoic acid export membrane protein
MARITSDGDPGADRPSRDSAILSVAKGSGFITAGGMFEYLLRIVIAIILTRTLGAVGYGSYVLGVGVAATLSAIALFGMDDAMVRYVAIADGKKDYPGLRGTLMIGGVGAVISGLAAGALLFLVADPLAIRVFDDPTLAPLFKVFGIVVPFLTLSNVLLGMTRGFNRMGHATLGENAIQTVVRLVLLLIWASVGLEVIGAAVIFGISDLVATIALFYWIRRDLPYDRHDPPPARRETGTIVRYALPLGASGMLSNLRGNIQTFALGALSVVREVGIFGAIARVNMISRVGYRAVVGAVKPLVARAYAADDRQTLTALYSSTTRWTLTLGLPFFVATLLYGESILLVFGRSFVEGYQALVILAIGELVISATGTCGSLIDMAGHTRVKVVNSIVWVAMEIGLSLLLIPRWGVLGAAAATAISVAVINIVRVVEVAVLDRLQPFRMNFWKPLAAAGIAYGVGAGLRTVTDLPTDSLLVPAEAALMGIAYLAVVWMLGISAEDRMILDRVGRKLGRRTGRASEAT